MFLGSSNKSNEGGGGGPVVGFGAFRGLRVLPALTAGYGLPHSAGIRGFLLKLGWSHPRSRDYFLNSTSRGDVAK